MSSDAKLAEIGKAKAILLLAELHPEFAHARAAKRFVGNKYVAYFDANEEILLHWALQDTINVNEDDDVRAFVNELRNYNNRINRENRSISPRRRRLPVEYEILESDEEEVEEIPYISRAISRSPPATRSRAISRSPPTRINRETAIEVEDEDESQAVRRPIARRSRARRNRAQIGYED